MASAIRTVLVIGASGTLGRQATKHLLANGFQVSGLIRDSSKAELPNEVKVFRTDYSEKSLEEAFKGQDAAVSTISGDGLGIQKAIVDAAVAAGVKFFLPSEYGIDTSNPDAPKLIPFLKSKVEALDYLKSKQDQISWAALITGSLFDWSLNIPSFGGINVPARTATVYDSGDVPYEASTCEQVGKAIAAALKRPDIIKNQYVYVNSFTVTQNQVVQALEKATGDKFAVSHDSVENLRAGGHKQLQEGNFLGTLALIASTFYGKFGVADYSITKGLWDEKLGLAQEDLDAVLRSYVATKK